ncbi:MAG: cytochrome c3 family protein [Sulfurimonas sp.]|uniref:cytochrome c3 family protein n=1 Tax=Sulfurimonas sp. TaxID=2022749 RepID=UPI0028CF1C09|nr:cytochrome c3 family protein [Sulfurimonas sp.]MDT8337672.1 cytochrome c3 family protein [Sulfurimonas sp.]
MRYLIFALFAFLLVGLTQLPASIVNTKHNLSVGGTGTAKATIETEVCVFCHVPHFSQPIGKPLWNRSMPTTDYVMYDSEYLRRMGYPSIAANLGSDNDTPGALSRQCLSCHDGTIAIGAVSKLRYDYDGAVIDMGGVDPDGTIIDTATGFIGTDLSHHHPVGVEYDSTISKTFGNGGIRSMELKATPDTPIKLFEYPGYGGKYVECSSCHDPHKENSKFLHFDSGTNHAANFVGTCTSCHEKTSWVGSVHQSPPGTPTYTDADLIARYGTGAVGELGCANCHVPHNGQGVGYLNRQVLEQTCFQGAASSEAGAACHGVGGAKDIKSILSRAYTHPVLAEDNLPGTQHTNLDALYGTGNPDPLGYKGMDWATNKHAVCMDCHNPHRARAGTHIVDGSWYGAPGASTNLVSNVLQGVTGIEPTWPTAWTQPTTFTTMESAEKEYQICFKCHSYWGIGDAVNGVNTSGYVSPSDLVTPLTDVAWEMNINNKSGHPVVINQLARTGSYAPKELDTTQLWTPWKENPGLNTMYCSDCHGADNELGGDPKGPHGSNLKYILKGVNQYWPMKPDGVTLYTMDDLKNNTDAGLFCKNCHDPDRPHTDWWNRMANRGFQCVQCHVAIPHGSPLSRLFGYSSFPAPYNYGGNKLATVGGYRKNAYTMVDSNDVYSSHAGGGMCHGTNAGGYDANLMP